METLTDLLLNLGARDVLLADTDERKTSIWDARGTFLEAIKSGTPSMDECDVVVPRDQIAVFVQKSILIGKEAEHPHPFVWPCRGWQPAYLCVQGFA